MADIQDEIELLRSEIQQANDTINAAITKRRAIEKDSPLIADANAAVAAARQALAAVEIKLRALYESKDD
jgi:hypothetical protein